MVNRRQAYIYILASKRNGTLYTGVTTDLLSRVKEHKDNINEGFTKRYVVHTLVYYEQAESILTAIQREKQMKKWKREWKIALIEKNNPAWKDLFEELLTE